MKELREQLKKTAEQELQEMVEQADGALSRVKVQFKSGEVFSVKELARLVVGGRIANLEKQVIGRMVKDAGERLLKKYMDQQDLPLETNDEKTA